MTLKAFAEKYGVSYTLVCEASAKVDHVSTIERDCDYLEKDLYEAVMDKLDVKLTNAMRKAEQYLSTRNHMFFVRNGK